MLPDTGPQRQTLRQFLGEHGGRVLAEDDVHIMLGRIEMVEQPLGIDRAAGTGDGDEETHDATMDRKPRDANPPVRIPEAAPTPDRMRRRCDASDRRLFSIA